MCLIEFMISNKQLYLSGLWVGVNLRTKKHVWKYIELHIQNIQTILDTIINIMKGTYMIIQRERASSR